MQALLQQLADELGLRLQGVTLGAQPPALIAPAARSFAVECCKDKWWSNPEVRSGVKGALPIWLAAVEAAAGLGAPAVGGRYLAQQQASIGAAAEAQPGWPKDTTASWPSSGANCKDPYIVVLNNAPKSALPLPEITSYQAELTYVSTLRTVDTDTHMYTCTINDGIGARNESFFKTVEQLLSAAYFLQPGPVGPEHPVAGGGDVRDAHMDIEDIGERMDKLADDHLPVIIDAHPFNDHTQGAKKQDPGLLCMSEATQLRREMPGGRPCCPARSPHRGAAGGGRLRPAGGGAGRPPAGRLCGQRQRYAPGVGQGGGARPVAVQRYTGLADGP